MLSCGEKVEFQLVEGLCGSLGSRSAGPRAEIGEAAAAAARQGEGRAALAAGGDRGFGPRVRPPFADLRQSHTAPALVAVSARTPQGMRRTERPPALRTTRKRHVDGKRGKQGWFGRLPHRVALPHLQTAALNLLLSDGTSSAAFAIRIHAN